MSPWNFAFWVAGRSHKWQLVVWMELDYEDFENVFSGMPMKGEI